MPHWHREAELRTEFRTHLILLILVTAINNRGHSILNQDYVQVNKDLSNTALSAKIDAVAEILVRDHRAVAVAVPNSPYHQLAPYVLRGSALQVYVIQDEELQCKDAQLRDHDITVTPISNADMGWHQRSEDIDRCPQPSSYILTKGISHFDVISDGHWECLNIPKQDRLEHHIATVEDYIRRYNALSPNSAAQTDLFHTFTRYLIASCWRKMYERYTHWSSLGFVYILGSLDEKGMRQIFNSSLVKSTTRKDSALAIMIKNKTLLDSVSKEYRTPDGAEGEPPTFTRFANVLGTVEVNLAYNEHTCFEFHQILVAALLGYGKSLQAFAKAMNQPDAYTIEGRRLLAQRFLQFSRLLWRVAYSQSLTQHLEMLEAGHLLRLPSGHEKARYESYAGLTSAPVPPPAKIAKEAGKERYERTGQGDGDGEETGELLAGDDEMRDELQHMKMCLTTYTNAITGGAEVFKKWIRLFVCHWKALDTISAFSKSEGGNLENSDISLISINSSTSCGSSIGDWKDTVRALASTVDAAGIAHKLFDVDAAIKMLETQIESVDDYNIVKTFQSITSTVQASQKLPPVQTKTAKSSNTVHCEAVLAVLASNGCNNGNAHGDGAPSQPIERSNPMLFGIPKLCCPVCWDLLAYLRADSQLLDSSLRGCHSSLSLVELPPCLPPGILEKMVVRYKDHLRNQIGQMLVDRPTSQHHRKSSQSGIVASSRDAFHSHIRPEEDWS